MLSQEKDSENTVRISNSVQLLIGFCVLCNGLRKRVLFIWI